MLGAPSPATATLSTTTTPASPTRPSRLRGLSYLRSYTHNHLHPRSEAPPLTRSTSSPIGGIGLASPGGAARRIETSTATTTASGRRDEATSVSTSQAAGRQERIVPSPSPRPSPQQQAAAQESVIPSSIQAGENGWVPTVQGRSGLSRDAALTSTDTDPASPEPMTRAISSSRSATSNTAVSKSNVASTIGGNTATPATAIERQSGGESSMQTEPSLNGNADTSAATTSTSTTTKEPLPSIRFIPHTERSTRPSLSFSALSRTLKSQDSIVRVGRYSERDNAAVDPNTTILPVGFKSKVVSRRHCELWCTSGQWYIKDVKSSSGTFLNHVRLSPPGMESRPFPVNDGDVVQLGIDFKGGEEVIFRCVKIRIECNRGWQKSLNSFNTSTHKRLRNLTTNNKSSKRDSDAQSTHSSECSICLNPVAPCQALFVAPCSHVWHYKCVRNLINGNNYPNFLCPNCRFVADLDADVEPPEEEEDEFEDGPEEVNEVNGDDEGNTEEDAQGGLQSSDGGSARHDDDNDDNDDTHNDSLRNQDDRSSHLDVSSPPAISATDSSNRAQFANSSPGNQENPTTTQQPLPIPGTSQSNNPSSIDFLNARSATPTSTIQFALAAGTLAEGPMTPRNDVGPFVFDGSAGRRGRGDGNMGED